MKHSLSYAYFDGVSNAISNKPYHIEFEASNRSEMRNKLGKIIDSMYKKMCEYEIELELNNGQELEKWRGPTNFDDYWKIYMSESDNKKDIIDGLMDRGYWVWNYYQKWYIVAFSLDYTRFNVVAKDCDKKLIKWRYTDENDPIK